MKLSVYLSAAVLAAGFAVGSAGVAHAQSDRTLGVECTVAGHIHCGENGPLGGPAYRRGYGHGAYAWYPYHRYHHRRHVHRYYRY